MSKLGRALLFFTGSSVFGTLTQIAKGKLAAIALGAAGVGVLNQLNAMWSLFNTGSGMGLYAGLVRHVAEHDRDGDRDAARRQFASVAYFIGGMSTIAAAVGVVFSRQISDLIFADDGARAGLVALVLLSVPLSAIAQCYRCLLSGLRLVGPQIKARVTADAVSVIAFAALVFPLGVVGGVLGFMSVHIAFFGLGMFWTWRVAGRAMALPSARDWRWCEVRRNISYGASGVLIVASNVAAVMTVSRWIIEHHGADSNGVYSTAWKVSSVYLAALYNVSSSYYLPALTVAENDREMVVEMNRAIRVYLYILTPLVLGLIGGGELMMTVLFSREFAPAALLLLALLPGDLFRVLSDAIGVAFLARRRLVSYALVCVCWAGVYVSVALPLLDRYGLMGAAIAYLVTQAGTTLVIALLARGYFGFGIERSTGWAILRTAGAVGCVAVAGAWLGTGWTLCAVSIAALLLWLGLSLLDPGFGAMARQLARRLKSS